MKMGSCQPPPVMGILELIPTEDTPGIAASLCEISSCMRTTCSSPFACDLRIEMRKVCNAAGSANPGLTLVRARKVRIIKPEQINKTSARATWTTTRTLRARCCSLLWLSAKRTHNHRKHASNVGVDLLQGDAGPESGETVVAEIAEVNLVAVKLERGNHGGIILIEEMKALRQNANNLA